MYVQYLDYLTHFTYWPLFYRFLFMVVMFRFNLNIARLKHFMRMYSLGLSTNLL